MKEVNDYSQKCEMNLEADCVLRFFGIKQIEELSMLTSSVIKKKDEEDGENLEGITKKMRAF